MRVTGKDLEDAEAFSKTLSTQDVIEVGLFSLNDLECGLELQSDPSTRFL